MNAIGRRHNDRGAVAVMFAVLLVPLLAMTALVVDVGALYAEKSQLQNATDAAALAIAQDCAAGACGNTANTASTFAGLNAGGSTATSTVTGTSVTVKAQATVAHWFAPAIGIKSSVVTAASTVRWGAVSGGITIFPLTFSKLAFTCQTGQEGSAIPSDTTPQTISFEKTDTSKCRHPSGGSGNAVPGGFGWLKPNHGDCTVLTSTDPGNRAYSDTGKPEPSGCNSTVFSSQLNKTVLIPVYDLADATGSNAWYHIYAYAAFRLTGYDFVHFDGGAVCAPSNACIIGYFTRFVDLSDLYTYTATTPNLGASIITLTA